ncbi:NUDIX hydrolase [Candidatus Saccharibacteria bacterium]|nr:NUDIX hydrolase [Candidatus Saccharibacteria bacterium]
MTREFRVGPERYFFDAPGGMVDEGEDMEEAAKRELLEETGYEAGKIEYMGLFYIGAYDETRWQCFLATECERKAEQKLDEAEFIEVVLKSREEVLGEIEKGDMVLGDAAVMMMAMRRIEEKK